MKEVTLTEQRSADEAVIAQLSDAGLTGPVQESDNGFMPYDPADQASAQQALDLEKGMASKELLNLLEQVQRDVTAWIPNTIGESLMGTVIDTVWVDNKDSEYDPYWMVVVETPSGRMLGFHGYHTTIARNIEQKKASGELVKGSQIAISYRGEGVAKGKRNAPKLYNMALIAPTQA